MFGGKVKEVRLEKGNGIIVYLYGAESYVSNSKGEIILFKNQEVAKAYLANNLNIVNPHMYRFYLYIEKNTIDFNYVNEREGVLEFYTETGKYIVHEVKNEKLVSIGYIKFNDLPELQDFRQAAIRNNKQLKKVQTVIGNIIHCPEYNPGFTNIGTNKFNHVYGQIRNCTGKINVCTNKDLIGINMNRREAGERCLPFLKDIPALDSIYIYGTKDDAENNPNIDSIISNMINTICYELNCLNNNVSYIPCDKLNGYIRL